MTVVTVAAVRDGEDGPGSAGGTPAGGRGALGWLEWVRRSSGPARFYQYTRYTLYSFAPLEGMLLVGWTVALSRRTPGWATAVLTVLFAAHVVCQLRLCRDGLRYYLGTAGRPRRPAAAHLAVTVAGVTVLHLMNGTGVLGTETASAVAWLLMFLAGPLSLVLPLGRTAGVMALVIGGSALASTALGVPPQQQVFHLAGAVVGSVVLGVSYRGSGWAMRVVDELEAAKETQARLAVAEERLRFGRDLHDVLGRNLSVIALKSELAVHLARRGSPAAVDQMTEVQRVARESQREMRDVVRGYREADLHTELVGARGVLRAAGIDCRIEDSGSGRLPETLQSVLGWVIREGTTNVLRHAEALRCTIRLRITPEGGPAVLVMENDGVAEAAAGNTAADGGGSGLAGLRERLAAFDGTLSGERRDGGVFRLTARVPTPGPRGTGGGRTGGGGTSAGDMGETAGGKTAREGTAAEETAAAETAGGER